MSEKKNRPVKDCTLCGLCKASCPVFKATKDERYSSRARSILIKENLTSDILYMCTLCKACENECPENIDLPNEIRKAREQAVKEGKETEANKTMIKNLREYGNPFGKKKKGEIPKDLYCC